MGIQTSKKNMLHRLQYLIPLYIYIYARENNHLCPSSPLKAVSFIPYHPLSLITARWRVQGNELTVRLQYLSLSLSPIRQLEYLSKFPIAFRSDGFADQFPTRFSNETRLGRNFFNISRHPRALYIKRIHKFLDI